jgi:hypothetical protein
MCIVYICFVSCNTLLRIKGLGLHLCTLASSLSLYAFVQRACKMRNLLPKQELCMWFISFKTYISKSDLISLYHARCTLFTVIVFTMYFDLMSIIKLID